MVVFPPSAASAAGLGAIAAESTLGTGRHQADDPVAPSVGKREADDNFLGLMSGYAKNASIC